MSPREPDDYDEEPVRRGYGSKEKEKVKERVIKGTTADGIPYKIYVGMGARIKQGAQDFTVGAAKFAGRSALSVGKGAVDFMDSTTFDFQGKRAERDSYTAR